MLKRTPKITEELGLAEIAESLGSLRPGQPARDEAMRASLMRYGQISAVVVFEQQGLIELIDGFKRLRAARSIDGLTKLVARFLPVDNKSAKAAMLSLNQIGGRAQEMEEARIVHSLIKDDGLNQIEVAELLGRHKSWVCRRLRLIETLCDEAQHDVRLGLLSATAAREVGRLPHGNQQELLAVVHRDQLQTAEVASVVRLLLSSADWCSQEFVLREPREALLRAKGTRVVANDPRLGLVGNQVRKRLAPLLDAMPRMESWLQNRGHAELLPVEQEVLHPSFISLAARSKSLHKAVTNYVQEAADT